MPKVQSTFDASQSLNDDDCDIMGAYGGVVDSAYDMRRQFSSVLHEARQLKTDAIAKRVEIGDLTNRNQRLQNSNKIARDKLRTQGNKVRRYKEENRLLRLRNRELANDLEAKREELDKIDHLRCDVCTDSFKNSVLITCGHGFCKECITVWLLQERADDPENDHPENKNNCPSCRRMFKESDIQEIFLGSDGRTPAVLESGDGTTEIQLVDSDSE